ncbi:MAG: hypothetical protein QM747_15315 [Nocardioides sp.]
MTGQLRTTFQARADQLEGWDLDLDTIVRQGERRLRRRRVTVAGGLAGVLVVAGALATFAGHLNRTTAPPADQNAKPVTYAVGSVIHDGSRTVDVGMHVDSYVRLTSAFVFTHGLHVYAAQDGGVHQIGDLANTSARLVAGEDGRQVGWWRGHDINLWPGYPGVHGRPNGMNATLHGEWPPGSPPRVQASWGGFFWVSDGVRSRVVYHDPPDGPYEGWPIRSTGPSMIQDAAERSLLVRVGDGMAVVDANLPHELNPIENSFDNKKSLLPDAPQVPGISTGDLAPDTRHWFTTQGGFRVYAAGGRTSQVPDHDGFVDVTPYQWLSGDTIAATAEKAGDPGGPVSLLTCRVSTNTCTLKVADVAPAADLVVPNGPTTRRD